MTAYDKIKQMLLNNKFVAWGIIVFMALSGIIAFFSGLSGIVIPNLSDTKVIINPGDIEVWEHFEPPILFYNAPFTLIDEDHVKLKYDLLQKGKNGIAFKILFFNGLTDKDHLECRERMKRLGSLLTEIQRLPNAPLDWIEQKVEIRINETRSAPTVCFFLMKDKDERNLSLIYIYQQILLGESAAKDKISYGLIIDQNSDQKGDYEDMSSQFNIHWNEARAIDVKSLLGS